MSSVTRPISVLKCSGPTRTSKSAKARGDFEGPGARTGFLPFLSDQPADDALLWHVFRRAQRGSAEWIVDLGFLSDRRRISALVLWGALFRPVPQKANRDGVGGSDRFRGAIGGHPRRGRARKEITGPCFSSLRSSTRAIGLLHSDRNVCIFGDQPYLYDAFLFSPPSHCVPAAHSGDGAQSFHPSPGVERGLRDVLLRGHGYA